MIVTAIGNLARYRGLSAALDAALDWVAAGAWRSLPDGRHEPSAAARGGSNPLFYASLSSYETKPEAACGYETHRKHIDIHILMSGNEFVDVRGVADLSVAVPYDEKDDIEYYSDRGCGASAEAAVQRVRLASDVAAIFFPEDAHKPGVAVGAVGAARKIVVKVAEL
ncbi:MAG: YhcH/YjgK/YiaL family protein [Spirochaetes bacterium]|nr:YhcH/YjgK/YiaL family protein [Spirochaetota bacterium]